MKSKPVNNYTSTALGDILNSITPEQQKTIDRKMMLAAKIYDAMKAKGWIQKDLALALGKSVAEISRLLSGTQNPSATTLWAVGDALDIDLLPTRDNKPVKVVKYQAIIVPVEKIAVSSPVNRKDDHFELSRKSGKSLMVSTVSSTTPTLGYAKA